MLDFSFSFRWFRTLYIVVLAAFIFFVAEWIPAAICMLAVVDIEFDKDLFVNSDEEPVDDDQIMDDRSFGPDS